MRIQHNILAMNSYRNYNNNTGALGKNLEKLSSGYRINRAGDDAAGLAISEKMRAQITGLDAAQKNVQDGISLVKTAEGAMQEIQDMLNRMKYLAVQSANGTYENEVDRKALQDEVNALKDEINRIADSANFNGQKLLDGSLAATEVAADTAGTEVQDMTLEALTGATGTGGAAVTPTYNAAKGPGYETGIIPDMSATEFSAVKITYTNDAGERKELTLVEGAGGAITGTTTNGGGKDLADAINGGQLKLSSTDSNAQADLEEFLKLFKVESGTNTNTGDTLVITAKDPDSGAAVSSVAYKNSATSSDDAVANLAATGSTVEAEAANVVVSVAATGANVAASITIGGKEYVTSDEATASANNLDKINDLVSQLKEDGYDVEAVDTNNDNTVDSIKFKDMSQLQETQKGTQITNTGDDKWDVNAQASTKGKAEFSVVAATNAANATQVMTLNYVDKDGNTVSKDVEYELTAANAANTAVAAAIKSAIESDSELSELFKVTDDGAGKLTIESKGSGTASGYVTGVAIPTNNGVTSTLKITEPMDTGKTLEMALKADGVTPEKIKNGDQITVDGVTYQFMKDTGAEVEEGVVKVDLGADIHEAFKNLHKALEENGVEAELYRDATDGSVKGLYFTDVKTDVEMVTEGGLTLQIGDTADEYNQLNVTVEDMHVDALGMGDFDISTLESAQVAETMVTDAINYVSSVRGKLGAIQNRLEHTANNLSVMEENIQNAESAIRDTDIADEMTAYTKNNILLQSAQAMLAQANQIPQGVLQLLQ